jgi:hypothetical protein
VMDFKRSRSQPKGGRDIGAEILDGIREIKSGQVGRVLTFPPVAETRAPEPIEMLGEWRERVAGVARSCSASTPPHTTRVPLPVIAFARSWSVAPNARRDRMRRSNETDSSAASALATRL